MLFKVGPPRHKDSHHLETACKSSVQYTDHKIPKCGGKYKHTKQKHLYVHVEANRLIDWHTHTRRKGHRAREREIKTETELERTE